LLPKSRINLDADRAVREAMASYREFVATLETALQSDIEKARTALRRCARCWAA
jgi:hypothetical protein